MTDDNKLEALRRFEARNARGLVLAPLCNCAHFCDPGKQAEPYRCLHLPTGTPAPFTGTPYDPNSEED